MDATRITGASLGAARIPSGPLDKLAAAAARVAGDGALVFGPARDGSVWGWKLCEAADVPQSDLWERLVNTDVSPKELFMPRTEDIARWRDRLRNLSIAEPAAPPPVVVLGVRPCDAASFDLLDEVLIEGPFSDESYRRRRGATLLITWACGKTGPACACDAFGLAPAAAAGDLMVYPDGNELLLSALTPKGLEVLGDLTGGSTAGEALTGRVDAVAAALNAQKTAVGRRLALDDLTANAAGLTATLFSSDIWTELSPRCLSCGTCTYVCPTCYCFAINDEPRGGDGRRIRTWDSCQFKEFLSMAGGHNPRPSKVERVRQRFMHKLNYHPERYGKFLCVGCGRCIVSCPVGLHVAEVGEALSRAAAAAVSAAKGGE
ncbi:MAG: 4Fe-4S dicluster domain-containing protein [Bacillota bacterium]|nr:4Fe-4S dicluster domain-containing protein [Bacillota bacterium]